MLCPQLVPVKGKLHCKEQENRNKLGPTGFIKNQEDKAH